MTFLIRDSEENGESNTIHTLVFSPELNLLITSSENLIKLWQFDASGKWDGNPPQVLKGHEAFICCLSCFYFGEGAILASGSGFDESCVKLWYLDSNGVWNGNEPETLKIKSLVIKSIAMEPLEDGGILLVAGGGEYGDNLTVWHLTPGGKWDKNNPLVLKEFTYWASPVALCSFNNDKIILAVSGSWMETYIKLWTFDKRGKWDGNSPLTLNLPPNPDYESNYPRSFSLCSLNDKGAVLVAGIGSDEDEYWTTDAGYTIVWQFNVAGGVVEAKPMILDDYNKPVEQVILYPLGEDEVLLAYSINSNWLSVQFLKRTKKDLWEAYNSVTFEHTTTVKIGCFVSTPSKEIVLFGISGNELISWSVTASKRDNIS